MFRIQRFLILWSIHYWPRIVALMNIKNDHIFTTFVKLIWAKKWFEQKGLPSSSSPHMTGEHGRAWNTEYCDCDWRQRKDQVSRLTFTERTVWVSETGHDRGLWLWISAGREFCSKWRKSPKHYFTDEIFEDLITVKPWSTVPRITVSLDWPGPNPSKTSFICKSI